MKQLVCSIKDIKAELFAQPFFVSTEAVAVRSFTDLVNNEERGGTLNSHPEDYQLYVIATFDDNTGTFGSPQTPKHLVTGSSVKKETPLLNRAHIAAV